MSFIREKKVDVIIVEDNPDDCELTQFAMNLSSSNMNFVHFTDGREALNFILGREKYHGLQLQTGLRFVLVDIGLPTMNGLQFLKQIKENNVTKKLPVIMLTSSRDKEDMNTAYTLGANSYVIKPDYYDNYVKYVGSLMFYWGTVNERVY